MLTPRPAQVVFNPVASGIDLTPEQAPVDTSLGAVVGAAFARENVIGSLLAHQWSSSEIDPALTWDIIWDSIKGTKYEAYSDKFAAEVHNFGALAAMKRNIDLREEHDRTLAAAGLWGGVASFGAGLVSPENLVPGGAIVRGVRMGAAIGRSFLNTAAAAAVSTTAGEGVLLATQPTRSPLESAANVAGAAVFGGSFGGAIAAVAGRADIARATRAAVANVSARSGVPQADLSPEIRGEAIRAEVQAAIEGRAGGDASGPSVSATVADASERIRPLLDFKRRPGSETSVVDIAPVSPPLAQIVRRHTGIDVTRYTHVIDAASVRRILQPNDDLDVGLPHGRLPVTDEDVVAIPSVLANATHVITGMKHPDGHAAIAYISKTPDGSVAYLEQQVVRSRRRLVTRAIRKYPPETTPESIAASLDTTVRRAPGEFLTLTEIAPDAMKAGPLGHSAPPEIITAGVSSAWAGAAGSSGKSGAGSGRANSNDYRGTFLLMHPELTDRVVVHHAIEQRVLKRYPGLLSSAEMHSYDNLRGIPKELNSDLHLSQIRREWDQFYRQHANPTRQDLIDKKAEIDAKYGRQFLPPR